MKLYRKYTASCSKIQSLGKKGLGPKTLRFKQNLAVLKRYSLFRYFSQFCCSVKGGHKITGDEDFLSFRSSHQRTVVLLKKRLWHRCFPVNFVKFSRTPFLQNTSGRLLLFLQKI